MENCELTAVPVRAFGFVEVAVLVAVFIGRFGFPIDACRGAGFSGTFAKKALAGRAALEYGLANDVIGVVIIDGMMMTVLGAGVCNAGD